MVLAVVCVFIDTVSGCLIILAVSGCHIILTLSGCLGNVLSVVDIVEAPVATVAASAAQVETGAGLFHVLPFSGDAAAAGNFQSEPAFPKESPMLLPHDIPL
jgi:hypothetical protein